MHRQPPVITIIRSINSLPFSNSSFKWFSKQLSGKKPFDATDVHLVFDAEIVLVLKRNFVNIILPTVFFFFCTHSLFVLSCPLRTRTRITAKTLSWSIIEDSLNEFIDEMFLYSLYMFGQLKNCQNKWLIW